MARSTVQPTTGGRAAKLAQAAKAAKPSRAAAAVRQSAPPPAKSGAKGAAGKPRGSGAAPGAPQHFTVSHAAEGAFKTGLRRYAAYRDLGIAEATGGMVQAHVIRFVPPYRPEEVSKLHLHDVEFQMIYVLKGWMKSEFEGKGEILMQAGSCWIQPPRIRHKVTGYSDDCEVLEIILPAQFDTVELE